MNTTRVPSAYVNKKIRKKSVKKKDNELTSLSLHRGPSSSYVDGRYRAGFPSDMNICPKDEDVTKSSEMQMDTSESTTHFPFQLLPELCKQKVWSFLTPCDLGRCMQVCLEWQHMIQKSLFWSSVRFGDLPYSCLPQDRGGVMHTEPICHNCFRRRVFSYSNFLSRICPKVQEFQFCFDISHPTDQFNLVIEHFISTADLSLLVNAEMNWKDTPSRASLKINQEPSQDYIYRYRKRQRVFSRLFETFVSRALCLTTLVVPFDWTTHNTENLSKLSLLENLVLEKYGTYNHIFTQNHLNTLLRNLKNLKHLFLEVWIPTCNNRGMEVYCVESQSLTYLDVSQCRGFYFKLMNTPNLQHLQMARQPWNRDMHMQLQKQSPHMACMCSVLSAGAPKLQYINGFHLEDENLLLPSEKLTNLMTVVCCCVKHNWYNGNDMCGL